MAQRRTSQTVDLAAELQREAERLRLAEAILGYSFREPARLLAALTHRSFGNEHATAVPHNEVLELVGDALLSLVTVDAMLADTPDADEGGLTDRRAAHVSEPSLVKQADAAGLVPLLRTGKAATVVVASAKADLVEALLGAVYLDGGLDAARAVALRLLGRPPVDVPRASSTNPKRTLQERLQGLFGETLQYEVERGEGPNHAPRYRARALFRGEVLGEGEGANKQSATEDAATRAVAGLSDDAALRARFGAGKP